MNEIVGQGQPSIPADPAAWVASLVDPFRKPLLKDPQRLPQVVPACADPLQGEPAFDPEEIGRRADAMPLPAGARFEHPLLERSVRVGLAHIDATFQGDHPRYGVGRYADPIHDGFPPTIIAAIDALTLWEQTARADALFTYWLRHFVREDGSIAYYGPSLSEYGQLLTTARRLAVRGGGAPPAESREALARVASFLQALLHAGGAPHLLGGVPEADERDEPAIYFHNNAWVVRGLADWADLLASGIGDAAECEALRADADRMRSMLLDALELSWPADPEDRWLRPRLEADGGYGARPEGRVTGNRFGSYTNYRYWPELLSSGVLPRRWMERVVDARLDWGGQLLGMTRFEGHLDDWPLADYLEGLWRLGRYDDYRLSLWGHICYHQADGHLTAYEQVSFPPGRAIADYCLPCQLVAARAAHRLAV